MLVVYLRKVLYIKWSIMEERVFFLIVFKLYPYSVEGISRGQPVLSSHPIIPCSWLLNPLTLMSDQDRISPYSINTISTRQVMRIKKYNHFGDN